MAEIQELKNHIRSIRDTQKITNAMYFISSTKLRRARWELDTTRPFFDALKVEIKRVFRTLDKIESVYFFPEDGRPLPEGDAACLVITADKGLAGDYNHKVIQEALRLREEEKPLRLYVVGEVGRHFFSGHGIEFEQSFQYSDQRPTLQLAREICAHLLPPFREEKLKRIFIVYTDMKNSLTQVVRSERLLPFHHDRFLTPDYEQPVTEPIEFIPSAEAVVDAVVPCYLVGYIYSALIDSYCSEQNARMLSMQAANENAEQLLQDLALQYNRARQERITREITEISAGARAQRQRREEEERI